MLQFDISALHHFSTTLRSYTHNSSVLFMQMTEMRGEGEEIHQEEEEGLSVAGRSKRAVEGKANRLLTGKS